jgi:hypothetical protein
MQKSPSHVRNVEKALDILHTSIFTWEPIVQTTVMNVRSVGRPSPGLVNLHSIEKLTLERNLTNVWNAGKPSLFPHA